jgi:hypothetical protein
MKDFIPTTDVDSSLITIERDLVQPILGSTTFVHEGHNHTAKTPDDSFIAPTRFMVLDDWNPLVSEFNSDGVSVASSKAIILSLNTVAGPMYSCFITVGFTPQSGKDYQIKLLGIISTIPHACEAQLWSTKKGTNVVELEQFTSYDDGKKK